MPQQPATVSHLLADDYEDLLLQQNVADIHESIRDSQRALSVRDFNEAPNEFESSKSQKIPGRYGSEASLLAKRNNPHFHSFGRLKKNSV